MFILGVKLDILWSSLQLPTNKIIIDDHTVGVLLSSPLYLLNPWLENVRFSRSYNSKSREWSGVKCMQRSREKHRKKKTDQKMGFSVVPDPYLVWSGRSMGMRRSSSSSWVGKHAESINILILSVFINLVGFDLWFIVIFIVTGRRRLASSLSTAV